MEARQGWASEQADPTRKLVGKMTTTLEEGNRARCASAPTCREYLETVDGNAELW
jgi:hypothetical protein